MTLPGSKISKSPENDSLQFLLRLELRRECKEDYMGEGKTGKSLGLDYRIVMISCALFRVVIPAV